MGNVVDGESRGLTGLPDGIIPLGQSTWPKEIKQAVSDIFQKIGLTDPLRQKAVEPYAIHFGGRKRNGEVDLSGVNWEMLLLYFRYEAAQCSHNDERAAKFQEEALKRFGNTFMHYQVYDPSGGY